MWSCLMETLVSAVGSATARMRSGPQGRGPHPTCQGFGASSNGVMGGRKLFTVPELPHGRGAVSWGFRVEVEAGQGNRQTQLGTFPGVAEALPGRPAGGRVCVRACMCVMTEGLWVLDGIYMLRHECVCQFIQNHTLKNDDVGGRVYTELLNYPYY